MRFKELNEDNGSEDWSEYRDIGKNNYIHDKYKQLENTNFHYSKEWLELRTRVLNYYGRICMKCADTDGIMQVDHIIPRIESKKLALEFDNMQVLCRTCNMKKSTDTVDYRLHFLSLIKIPYRE